MTQGPKLNTETIHLSALCGMLILRLSDVTEGQVRVRLSKSGKPRSVPLNDEGAEFFDRMTVGKRGDELVFTRDYKDRKRRGY